MKAAPHRSISAILSLLVLIAVLPVLAITLYTGFDQRRHSIATAKRDVQLLTHSMAEVLKDISRSAEQTLTILSQTRAVQHLDIAACNALFRTVAANHPEYLGITLVAVDGTVLASNRPVEHVSLADRKHVRDAIANKRFATGEYIVTRMGGRRSSFSFALPVLDEKGRIRGVLTLILHLENMAAFLDVGRLPDGSFVAITDHRGIRLFYHPDSASHPVGAPIQAQNWALARDAKASGIFIRRGSDGIRRIFAFDPLHHPDGSVYLIAWAGIPESVVLAPANVDLGRNLLFLALAAGLALFITWRVGRRMLIEPIQGLVAVTQRFAAGDMASRSPCTATAREVGMLARAFDNMADALAESQEKLRRREARLREAQRIGHIGGWEWDAVTERFHGSREMSRILGLSREIGPVPLAELETLFTPESARAMRAAVQTAMRTGTLDNAELECRMADGTSRWLFVRGEIRRDAKGGYAGLRGTALDISERVRAENERRQLQRQLVQSQKMESIGRLAGGVAHDFNNMLSIILGHVDMLLDDIAATDPLHESLVEIHGAAERSAELVRQLLAFARKQNVSPRVMNLNETIANMHTMLQRLIGEDIVLSWIAEKEPWLVKVDPGQVDQILANLCVNARDAIDGVGEVTIRTANRTIALDDDGADADLAPGEYVELTIRDNGCGMDAATRKNIFEPFFTTKEPGKGTGLGLSTVFGIVKQNRGHVAVDSRPGQGTTVTILLPRDYGVAEATSSSERVPEGGGETVLLVEDESMVLQMTRRMLTRSGYTVLAAATSGEAMALAERHGAAIRLLITDVIMPDMDGPRIARQIQARHPGIKVLFMSGYTANIIARHGILEPGLNFIQKPFSREALATMVRKVLDTTDGQ